MKVIFRLFFLLIMAGTVLVSCEEELGLEPYTPEPKPDDLPIIGSEIYMTANIGSQEVVIQNGVGGYGNGIDSAWYQFCSDTTFDVLKGQSFYFNQFTDTTNVNSIWFEFLKCSPDTAIDVRFDSVIVLGTYGFGSIKDTIPGLVVTWIDNQQKVWKSAPEDSLPNGQNGTFTITDVVQNYDGFSEFIAAGTFEGTVYDTVGNALTISNGKVITRMGRNY